MFRSDTDALPTDPTTPGGWASPGGHDADAAPWPARGGFFTGGGGPAPLRPGDGDPHAEVHRPGGEASVPSADGVAAARLDEEDDFEEDFYDEDDEDEDDLYDDEEIDDDEDDDLLDDEDDEDFDFEEDD